MRVTEQMVAASVIQGLENSQSRLATLNNQLTSGKQLTQMSDNPSDASQALAVRTNTSLNTQYLRNVDSSNAWLSATDTALGGVDSVLQRARVLAVQGANDTLSTTDRQNMAAEVNSLIGQAVQMGNTQLSGNYIFAGAQSTELPFSDVNGTVVFHNSDPASSTTPLQRAIGPGTSVVVNTIGHDPTTGKALFDQVFSALTNLSQALQSGTTSNVQASITQVTDTQNALAQERATVGGKMNDVTAMQTQLKALQTVLAQTTTTLEDTDMAQAATYFASANTVQQAAVAAASKSFPPTLFSYLA